MKKIIYYIATSVDNFIAYPDGSADGFLNEGPHVQDFLDSLAQFDTVLMGKNTYEYGFQFGMKAGDPAYAPFNLKNYIFSRSMQFKSNEQIQLVDADEIAVVQKLKQTGVDNGKQIWLCGGGAFASTLLEHKLIDELVLKVHPVIFGEGIPLFGQSTQKVGLTLHNTRSLSSGVMVNSYSIQY